MERPAKIISTVEEIVEVIPNYCGKVSRMNIAQEHIAAFSCYHPQLQLAAPVCFAAPAGAGVRAMYLARMKAGEIGSMEPCFYTYYSYRYI